MVKNSPSGDKGGVSIPSKASAKAAIPVLEVNARAEKRRRGGLGGSRKRWTAEMVGGVGSTVTVGHQRGAQPLRWMRWESLPA